MLLKLSIQPKITIKFETLYNYNVNNFSTLSLLSKKTVWQKINKILVCFTQFGLKFLIFAALMAYTKQRRCLQSFKGNYTEWTCCTQCTISWHAKKIDGVHSGYMARSLFHHAVLHECYKWFEQGVQVVYRNPYFTLYCILQNLYTL